MTVFEIVALIVFGIPWLYTFVLTVLAFRFREQPLGHTTIIVFAVSTIALLVTFLGLR